MLHPPCRLCPSCTLGSAASQDVEREIGPEGSFSRSTSALGPPLRGFSALQPRFSAHPLGCRSHLILLACSSSCLLVLSCPPAHPLASTHVLLPDIRFHIRNLHALPVCLGSHVLTPMSVFHVQTLMPSPQTLGPVIYLSSCSASPSTPVRSRTPAQSRGSGPTTRFKLLLTSI